MHLYMCMLDQCLDIDFDGINNLRFVKIFVYLFIGKSWSADLDLQGAKC